MQLTAECHCMNAEIVEEVMNSRNQVAEQIRALGGWFHNIDSAVVQIAPEHFLGDYPRLKRERFQDAIPSDLRCKSVLDIGCNARFYSIQTKHRGADRVLGIDFDERYLTQAKFATEMLGCNGEFRKLSVYDVHEIGTLGIYSRLLNSKE